MLTNSQPAPAAHKSRTLDWRLAAGALLLLAAAFCTWRTIGGLAARRVLRTDLAEISHARYGLLNIDRWVAILTPILESRIDALDLTASNQASLRPTVENALYRLLDDVKAKMAPQTPPAGGLGALMGQGNALMANMMIGALRPHVPEYAGMVLNELGRPENKQALKKYIKSTLAESARATFGNADMRVYNAILKRYGCADGAACRQTLRTRIEEADRETGGYCIGALAASALAFALLMIGRPALPRGAVVLLMLFCVVLLLGGILTPMIEVEAKISRLSLTFLGTPITFSDQVLYFQSKSVLEVFRTLVTMGKPDMWIVGVLVLTFSVVFPALKILTLSLGMFRPALLGSNRLMRFFALESSKWSMADVMALAIFMSYVAFNGLIANTMGHLQALGAELAIPTDSSKILPGYILFIGFCLASLFLSKKLEHGIALRAAGDGSL